MTAKEIIAQAKELPTVSETARKLVALLNQPDTHRDELIRTLRCDNVLTAKLLRVCNSAHTGLQHPVASIDQAVLLLGDNTIFRMVCAIGFGGSMGGPLPGYAVEANGLWSHSLSTGMGAECLCEFESYGNFPASMAFTAGLLHDIGKLVLNQLLTPKARTEIRAKIADEGFTRTEAERAVLGADHAEVGACLLQKWSVPEIIVEAVANHHAPVAKPEIQLSAVVYLANCAAYLSGAAPSDAYAVHACQAAALALGMELKKVEMFIANVDGAMKGVNELIHAA
jgi:putative nucleotidyltransferase with HDIG domain